MNDSVFYTGSKGEELGEASFSKPPSTDVIWFMVATWHWTFLSSSPEKKKKKNLIEHFCKYFQRIIYGSARMPDCLILRQLKQEFRQSLFASLGENPLAQGQGITGAQRSYLE